MEQIKTKKKTNIFGCGGRSKREKEGNEEVRLNEGGKSKKERKEGEKIYRKGNKGWKKGRELSIQVGFVFRQLYVLSG